MSCRCFAIMLGGLGPVCCKRSDKGAETGCIDLALTDRGLVLRRACPLGNPDEGNREGGITLYRFSFGGGGSGRRFDSAGMPAGSGSVVSLSGDISL